VGTFVGVSLLLSALVLLAIYIPARVPPGWTR